MKKVDLNGKVNNDVWDLNHTAFNLIQDEEQIEN